MNEDSGVKAAPVTRLRRRLSVESEDTKSPSAPSTPTKKRSTRLAAKPQLELIDEHAVTSSPKRTTRKSISKDIVEADEKPATPARRNARTKSNTSVVSEAEEKPLTPARRSTRIKSNTSIVSEAAQSVESPRAKRAIARRNSQLGSDNETPVTPARTRRTRKASTSSIDKEETPVVSETAVTPGRTRRSRKSSTSSLEAPAEAAVVEKQSLITEVIVEEPENKNRKSTSEKDDVENKDDSPTRKSPRLMAKKTRKSKSSETHETQKKSQENDEYDNIPPSTREQPSQNAQYESNISVSSANLIKELETFGHTKNKNSYKNRSLSDIEDTKESKKRNRTKSWTTLCASSPPIEGIFYSDNESKKKKLKKNSKIFSEKSLSYGDDTGSGDGVKRIGDTLEEKKELSMPKNNRKSKNNSIINKTQDLEKSLSITTKDVDISNESNNENLESTSKALNLFESAPRADVKLMVFIEDSDSNSGSLNKGVKPISSEDQCVPVVLQQSENKNTYSEIQANNIFDPSLQEKNTNDESVEPMDIDETMPENISLSVFADEGKRSRKSSLAILQELDTNTKTTRNKSGRKSSLSNSLSQIFQDTEADCDKDENKKASKSLLRSKPEIDDKSEESISSLEKETVSERTLDDKAKNISKSIPSENLDASKDKSMPGGISQNSSNIAENESDNNLSKSKKSKSISEDDIVNCSYTGIDNKSKQNIIIGEINKDSDSQKDNSKSRRKSSLSISMSHDKTGNEDKSTLKLSQIKDVSAAETSVSDSPKKSSDLSKSVNIGETNKDGPINKNLLNYLTSTPVQPKSGDKLAIQINTSVITPTNTSKKDFELTKNKPKKDISLVSKSSENESSDDSENLDEEDSSQDKNNLFDDKAEDAGEDYESGDSQDEDERQYERENELMDKGETLSSEEEVSDDSDYERDSFVVSSDEEDNELLSGSGDDLDLSDNELTLSAKSKKKYNERKLKEQKKASKEMFEARHGLNVSAKDDKIKKNNRSRLDSALLKSDEDILPPKKNKRMRLESTLETNDTKSEFGDLTKDASAASDTDEIGYKKKKSKRLSESICNESAMNEKEITIYNQNKTKDDDPLLVKIKTEPKTPQKKLEISRILVTDDVEHIQVDENVSMNKLNDTKDPLQATAVQDETESDNDSISENEEITNNYDSVLRELNKQSQKHIKSHDISLNISKKDKQLGKKTKTIIDELNITQTKISKKDNSLLAKEKSVKRVFKKLADTDESSDSIDLQLIFSDNSNDKSSDSKQKYSEVLDATASFISLKKSEAKTDIRQSVGDSNKDNEGSVNFFIDTKGNLEDTAVKDKDPAVNESDSDDAPVEVLYKSEKSVKSTSFTKTPTSDKNKKIPDSQDTDLQAQFIPTIKSSKKKKKGLSSHEPATAPVSENKKRESDSAEIINPVNESSEQKVSDPVKDTVNHPRKRKRKQSANKSADIESQALNTSHQMEQSVLGNKKKKLKIMDDNQIQQTIPSTGVKKTEKGAKLSTAVKENQPERETKINKKRKQRDEDKDENNMSKVFKENSFDKIHVPRLPTTIIEQLEDFPGEGLHKKSKCKAVSTSNFIVEETKKRKNKPSDFMEETVCLNDDENPYSMNKKAKNKKPKVLPFLPTVSTSDSGFTTNFQVNVISQKIEFVAQKDEVLNFKNDYLNNRIKKLRTYDLYKKQRSMKLSKY